MFKFDKVDIRNAMIFMVVELLVICSYGAHKMKQEVIIPDLQLEEQIEPVKLNAPVMEVPVGEPVKEDKEPIRKKKSPKRINVSKTLIAALIQHESNGKDDALGDYQVFYDENMEPYREAQAYGCLQIHYAIVCDVNEAYGLSYTHEDMFDREKAIDVCDKWLGLKGAQMSNPTDEKLARLWNGGWKYYQSTCTKRYWLKVKNHM